MVTCIKEMPRLNKLPSRDPCILPYDRKCLLRRRGIPDFLCFWVHSSFFFHFLLSFFGWIIILGKREKVATIESSSTIEKKTKWVRNESWIGWAEIDFCSWNAVRRANEAIYFLPVLSSGSFVDFTENGISRFRDLPFQEFVSSSSFLRFPKKILQLENAL